MITPVAAILSNILNALGVGTIKQSVTTENDTYDALKRISREQLERDYIKDSTPIVRSIIRNAVDLERMEVRLYDRCTWIAHVAISLHGKADQGGWTVKEYIQDVYLEHKIKNYRSSMREHLGFYLTILIAFSAGSVFALFLSVTGITGLWIIPAMVVQIFLTMKAIAYGRQRMYKEMVI